jgi:hypothetical protein
VNGQLSLYAQYQYCETPLFLIIVVDRGIVIGPVVTVIALIVIVTIIVIAVRYTQRKGKEILNVLG